MREISTIAGINLVLNINSCAHSCRYCFFDQHKCTRYPFERFLAVIERFIDWKQQNKKRLKKFDLPFTLFHCDDYPLAIWRKMLEMEQRLGGYKILFLGGLHMRSEQEMRQWLRARQVLGVRVVVATFAGTGAVHDDWNQREGDFDFLVQALKIAAELGMEMEQRLLLVKSTLPHIGELLDTLEAIPGKVRKRTISPFDYSGRAGNLEDERVTAQDIACLPKRALPFLNKLHSEREWVEYSRRRKEEPRKVILKLWLDDSKIDWVESLSCAEIVTNLERRTRAAYAALPTTRELAEVCGDPNGERLYWYQQELERKWLDCYLEKYPVDFERHLTHLTMHRKME